MGKIILQYTCGFAKNFATKRLLWKDWKFPSRITSGIRMKIGKTFGFSRKAGGELVGCGLMEGM